MKLSPKMRIIALCAVLVLVIAAGVFILTRGSDTPEESVTAENTPDNQAGQARDDASQPTTVSEPPMVYVETKVANASSPFLHNVYRYSGGGAVYNNGQMLDIVTQDVLCDVPQEWLSTYGADNYAFAFDEDDRLYLAAYDPEQGMLIISKDDAGQDVLLPLTEWFGGPPEEVAVPESTFADKLMVDNDYIYLLSYTEPVNNDYWSYVFQIFTRDGTSYATYKDIYNFDISSGRFYLSTYDNSLDIQCYDIASLELLYSAWGENIEDSYGQIYADIDTGIVYGATSAKVYAFDLADGRLVETLINFSNTQSDPGVYHHEIFILSDKTIYCTSQEQDGSCSLYQYSLEKDTRYNMPYTLTITAPYRDDFMTSAIRIYEDENPDQRILYDYTYSSRNEFTANAAGDGYEDRFNLDLLAGEVGDIVMTGNITGFRTYDFYSRFTSDLFIDLLPLLEAEPVYSKLDSTVLHAITIEGAVKGLPVSCSYPYAEINLDLCEQLGIDIDWQTATWSDLFSLVDQLDGTEYALFDDDWDIGFIERVINSNIPDLVDRKTNSFDIRQDWFIDLLNQLKAAMQSPNFLQSGAEVHPSTALISLRHETGYSYVDDSAVWYAYYEDFAQMNKIRVQIVPMFCGELNPNRAASSNDMYSISAWSVNKEAAWDFLSFLLRDDIQDLWTLRNRPLNVNVREARMQNAISDYDEAHMSLGMKYIEEMDTVYASVDYLYNMADISEPIVILAEEYILHDKALEDALTQCESQLSRKLNE